jgi:hypothetical protein
MQTAKIDPGEALCRDSIRSVASPCSCAPKDCSRRFDVSTSSRFLYLLDFRVIPHILFLKHSFLDIMPWSNKNFFVNKIALAALLGALGLQDVLAADPTTPMYVLILSASRLKNRSQLFCFVRFQGQLMLQTVLDNGAYQTGMILLTTRSTICHVTFRLY